MTEVKVKVTKKFASGKPKRVVDETRTFAVEQATARAPRRCYDLECQHGEWIQAGEVYVRLLDYEHLRYVRGHREGRIGVPESIDLHRECLDSKYRHVLGALFEEE